ncbi:MAG: hypothetical protein EA366_13185 [Spirulina sp. DLM2.Bin59]|nr:MAG: hypothetical protein EA366_13185 [Spirulina sp. DLM2.Bin59]
MRTGFTTAFATVLWALSLIPAQALQLGNQVIQFSEDTIIEFEIRRTQGANRSVVGIMRNPNSNPVKIPMFEEVKPFDDFGLPGRTDYLGTVAGGTIRAVEGNGVNIVATRSDSIIVEYRFRANTPYVFYMDVYTPTENRYINTLISTQVDATRFQGSLRDGNGIVMGWDDDGEGRVVGTGAVEVQGADRDFMDVTILVGGTEPCFSETAGGRPGPAVF